MACRKASACNPVRTSTASPAAPSIIYQSPSCPYSLGLVRYRFGAPGEFQVQVILQSGTWLHVAVQVRARDITADDGEVEPHAAGTESTICAAGCRRGRRADSASSRFPRWLGSGLRNNTRGGNQ